jgi:hypothetical protein
LVTFHIEKYWGNQFIVFTVPLPNRTPVFMSKKVTKYNESGVVIVDSEQFLELWRNEPCSIHSVEANGTPQTWPNDRKYGHAEKGFSYGYDNPVPLAYISHDTATRTMVSYKFILFWKKVFHEQFHWVGFRDGITRTIWLLAHGCKAFPIECEMPGARELHRVAAAPNTHFYTISELADVASHV